MMFQILKKKNTLFYFQKRMIKNESYSKISWKVVWVTDFFFFNLEVLVISKYSWLQGLYIFIEISKYDWNYYEDVRWQNLWRYLSFLFLDFDKFVDLVHGSKFPFRIVNPKHNKKSSSRESCCKSVKKLGYNQKHSYLDVL